MKKIVIITYSEHAAELYFDILDEVLQNAISLSRISLETDKIDSLIQADLAVISSFELYELVKKYVPEGTQILIPNLTIMKKAYRMIQDLPDGSRAILVNANFSMAVACVEQIYRFGARHIELIPYSPYLDEVKDVKIAITPGEGQNLPKWIDQVIDIGKRVIDINTIINILIYFNKEELFNTEKMKRYCRQIMPQNYLPQPNGQINLFSMNDFFMTNYRFGIISFTPQGIILNFNSVAEKILGYSKSTVIGGNVLDLFSDFAVKEIIRNLKPMTKKQIQINDQDLLVDMNYGNLSTSKICYLTFEKLHQSASTIKSYKNQIVGKGFMAKYHFKNIITQNTEMLKLKELGALNAVSDSSVLILGESGTGKELFAQAIHNASKRRDAPFVAINCAAVAESLLESELFGYDEGAFTGARRGGKKGLFELAHKGTIFLDEIGEMPVHLQARLLRVLQEKEISHIGGNKVISINIRIIAATNCNVLQLIREGRFRKDLYYRLNVATLKLPPLRERKEDIPLLISEFKNQMGISFDILPETLDKLYKHDWDGNIRELYNCIESFQNLRKPVITPSDVALSDSTSMESDVPYTPKKNQIEKKEEQTGLQTESLIILEILYEAKFNNKTTGRKSIVEACHKRCVYISEMRLRAILPDMEKQGLITILKGRGGTKITEKGIHYFENGE